HHRDIGTTPKKAKELSKALENEYRSGRLVVFRDWQPAKLLSYISDKLMVTKKENLILKTKKRLVEYRALCAYAMRVLCGVSYREICENMYNITISACAYLCSRGYELVMKKQEYNEMFQDLMRVQRV
ncbi:MAG: hypothetical protein N2484_05170, partial [Clostridia bacterium]|nr:hypothetical protein [Clostridia bacterium]